MVDAIGRPMPLSVDLKPRYVLGCSMRIQKENEMHRKRRFVPAFLILALFYGVGTSSAEQPTAQMPSAHQKEADVPDGVIGVSLHVGAERVGDPAVLYVAMVHPEGPAHDAGLAQGDQIVTVDGATVSGKSYEQIVKMIRGTAGTPVNLGVRGKAGTRELSIPRVPSESLSQGPSRSYRSPSP